MQRYKLETKLHDNYRRCVWRAVDKATGEPVAIKQVEHSIAKTELKVLHALASAPEVQGLYVPMLESIPDTDHVNIVMPLKGMSLHDMWHHHQKAPLATVLGTFRKVANIVAAMHTMGLMHGDIKMSNFMTDIEKGDALPDDFAVYVIDFGSAVYKNELSHQIRRRRLVSPTYPYSPPECVLDASHDDSQQFVHYGMGVDVWSLGCMLYEMLTFRYLFSDSYEDDDRRAFRRHMHRMLHVLHPLSTDDWRFIFSFKSFDQYIPKNKVLSFSDVYDLSNKLQQYAICDMPAPLASRIAKLLRRALQVQPCNRPTVHSMLAELDDVEALIASGMPPPTPSTSV